MKKILSLIPLIILVFCLNSLGQKIIINGEETNRKLTWTDFKGKVDMSSEYWAHTAYRIMHRYNVRFSGESATIGTFEVQLVLDSVKSWVKPDKQSEELLVHEQGHFTIGILCMKEILDVMKKSSFTKSSYSESIQTIVSNIIKKYNELGIQYDKETEHFKNKTQQEKWNSFLEEKMGK